MAKASVWRFLPVFGAVLGLVLLAWGLGLNVTGHESAQSWSLVGVGAATFGSSGISWRRRR